MDILSLSKSDGSRVEGGVTLFPSTCEQLTIYDAAMRYLAPGDPTIVFGGEEYEEFDIPGLDDHKLQQKLTLVVRRTDGAQRNVQLRSRIDTAAEMDYYRHGGILPFVLREILSLT